MEETYYIEAGVVLDRASQTENGKGDCLWRTALWAMIKGDYRLLAKVWDLLYERRRWPRELDNPSGIEHRKVTGFGSMTRDPYIMFYCAATMMDRTQFISVIKPPWYIYSPTFNTWRTYLMDPTRRKRNRWELTEEISLMFTKDPKGYALHLTAWMAWVTKDQHIMELLRPFIPHWNLLLRQLTLHPLRHLDEQFVQEYLPREGFIWPEDKWDRDRNYLMGSDPIQLDREALLYVYNKNITHG